MAHPRGTLLLRAQQRLARRPSTEPSFRRRIVERRRLRELSEALDYVEPVWSVNDKTDAYAWADRLGVRRPQVLSEHASVADVPWADLPGRFVLKPNAGSGGSGILLLERHGPGFRDLLRSAVLDSSSISAQLEDLAQRGKVSRDLVVEEMVDDPQRSGQAPVDWKFYTFFGEVGLVLARAPQLDARGRSAPRWRVLDRSWYDLGNAYVGHPQDISLALPIHRQELLEVAEEISAAVPRPFLRVDLYDDRKGPVFGEITPDPGGVQLFRRDVDRRLGALWEHAEARLLVRAGRAGVLDPADGPLAESASLLARSPAS